MITITILVIVYYFLSLTGILVFSNNPTISNEPGIPQNSKTLSSNLVSPKKGDFITYKFNDEYLGKQTRVHRLIGSQGDKILIKEGVVFVNDENIDKNYNLKHFYKVHKKDIPKVEDLYKQFDELIIENVDSTFIKVLLADDIIKKLSFKTQKLIEKSSFIDNEVYNVFNKKWNKDNFGPIIIPKGKIFVLGDNRDYSLDSRYEGFINETEITGVIFKIF